MKELLFNACVYSQEKLWVFGDHDEFMCINLETKRGRFVNPIGVESCEIQRLGDWVVADDRYIYCLELERQELVRYSKEKGNCVCFRLPAVLYENWRDLLEFVLYENKVYIFSKCVPHLIVFDTLSEEFNIKDKLCERIQSEIYLKDDGSLCCAVRQNNYVYLFGNAQSGKVLKYHMEKESCEIKLLSEVIGDIQYGTIYKNEFYLLGDKAIYRWDGNSANVDRQYPIENKNKEFGRISVMKQKIILLPFLGNQIYMIDKVSGDISLFDCYPEDFAYVGRRNMKYAGHSENQSYLWYANRVGNYCLRIDKNNDKLEWLRFTPPSFEEEYNYYRSMGKNLLYEKDVDLEVLFAQERKVSAEKFSDENGRKIWEEIKNI